MKTALTALCFLGFVFSSQAQMLTGKIFGKGETENEILTGATVVWLGTTVGATSNENGVFKINVQEINDRRLVASYLGYKPDTITVGGQTYISIILQPDQITLNSATVTGNRPTAYISNINAIKTEVITQKELTKAACCDLAGCFETQATVQPQTTNVITNAKELRILGLSGVYNQILFDGMPMVQGLSYTYGISSYPGTLIENIFVSKGANSVLQGYEGISGQISLEPKMPDHTDRVLLNVYMNNFMEKHFNLNYDAPVGSSKKWSTLLALHTVQPANKFDRDDDTFLDLPLLSRYMIYNRWKYGNEQLKGIYSHIGLRFLNEQRIGGQTLFNPHDENANTSVYGQTINYTQPELYTKTGYRLNDNHAITFMASSFYQNQNSSFGTVKYIAEQVNIYTNLQHEYLWKEKHLLKYGMSFRYQNIDENISFTDTALQRTYAGLYSTRQVVPGVFAENAFHWNNDKIVWIVGARLDHHQQFGYFFTPRTFLKYGINENHTVRASMGTGWRQVNLFSENINLLASSRDVVFQEQLKPEKGVNWGINYTHRYSKGNVEGTLSADFYQTHFFNQFFPDYDTDPTKAYIRNFTGKSLSNAFQLEAIMKFYEVFEFRTAYNFLDVYRIENAEKKVLPFNPQNRVMASVSYRPLNNTWYFDLNTHWYDKQQLPNTSANPPEYQNPAYSKPYVLVNAQVTYKMRQFEIYTGVENIFDFRQLKPIISWQDPFSKYFDTSSVWGPTRGREIYLGVRWKMK